jgi:tetratricopeptide (TPR) repeat protein
MLSACCGVREAQQTVATADSLRMHRGVAYGNGVPTSNMQRGVGDSIALAQAYTTFGRVQHIYPNDYARACYYYGRLLRNHGDQVAAMQAFINGSHAPYWHRLIPLPQFTDYHILGRIYSNMGTMCHLVDAFELSYEMYEHASEQILKTNDSVSYYYLLNDMALELAELNMRENTLELLSKIEDECTDKNVLTKTWETKAVLYRNIGTYDSAIIAAKHLYEREYYATSGYVVVAQSYWLMQQYDSALSYANLVVNSPRATIHDRKRMLYILMNNDSNITVNKLQSLEVERADLDYDYIGPLRQQLSVAIEILKQDMNSAPSFLKLSLITLALVIIGIIIWLSVVRFSDIIKSEITEQNNQLIKENDEIRENNEKIKQQYEYQHEKLLHELNSCCEALRKSPHLQNELHWKNYSELCAFIDHHFSLLATKLKATNKLGEKEIRMCILVFLDVNNKTIAQTIHYAANGIGKYKYRIAKKMGTSGQNLRNYLIEMALGTKF